MYMFCTRIVQLENCTFLLGVPKSYNVVHESYVSVPRIYWGVGVEGGGGRRRERQRARLAAAVAVAVAVCDDLDEHGDDDEMQGPSQQGVARRLEDMAISPSET